MVEPPSFREKAVLFSVDEILLPRQTLSRWQWAWRPMGPPLPERHVRSALESAIHQWDRRRWDALVHGVERLPLDDYSHFLRDTLMGIAGRPLPEAEVAAVVERFPRYPDEAGPFLDVVPFLRRLEELSVTFAVVADRPEHDIRDALHRAGLSARVDRIIGGTEAEPRPPWPAGFRGACSRLRTKPAQTLYIGSLFWSEMRAGARAGLSTVLMDRNGWWSRVQAPKVARLTDLLARFGATEQDTPSSASS